MKYRKHIIKSTAFVLLLIVTAAASLTGCSWNSGSGVSGNAEHAETPVSVAVVTGVRSNMNRISVNSREIADRIYESAWSCGRVALVRCDGQPSQYLLANIPEPDVEGLSESKLDSIAKGYRDEILATFDTDGAAVYPEADTLEAIRISADALSDADPGGEKFLVIADSGLSTTGYLDFTNDLFDAPTEDIIAGLEREKAVPDLSGVKVIWLYCGYTASPQEQLSELQKAKLREIYEAVFEAAGAAEYTFKRDLPTSEPYTGLPEVSCVRANDRKTTLPSVSLDPDKVRFIGDSAEFVEPETARATIKDTADELLAHEDNTVYVVGGTAGSDGSNDYCRRLSEARAEAVAKVLREYGVSDDRLIPLGLGSHAPWHVNDLDENGNMIENQAQKNRSVWIVDINDEEYGEKLRALR